MNTKFYACLLALGTFASAVSLNLTPVSAQTGNGSNTTNNVIFLGNGSNTTNNTGSIRPGDGSITTNNGQQLIVAITTQALATVNAVLGQILSANPVALASVTSNTALVPPGASVSVANAATDLRSSVAALIPGSITGVQLNAAINSYNTYATTLVESVGGEQALAFVNSSSTSAPSLRSQLLKLVQAAKS